MESTKSSAPSHAEATQTVPRAIVRFRNRAEAGVLLGEHLATFNHDSPVVVGLANGGIPVAYRVASRLHAALEVMVVRKLGAPYGPAAFAFGAISEDGVRILNSDVVSALGLSPEAVDMAEATQRPELHRRVQEYRTTRPAVSLLDQTVILVDDGLATGATACAAIETARLRGAAKVIVALPVASPDALSDLGALADEIICLHTPAPFATVGQWYDRFDNVYDAEVAELLAATLN